MNERRAIGAQLRTLRLDLKLASIPNSAKHRMFYHNHRAVLEERLTRFGSPELSLVEVTSL